MPVVVMPVVVMPVVVMPVVVMPVVVMPVIVMPVVVMPVVVMPVVVMSVIVIIFRLVVALHRFRDDLLKSNGMFDGNLPAIVEFGRAIDLSRGQLPLFGANDTPGSRDLDRASW